MSVRFSTIQHKAKLAFAIGSYAGHYEDEHSSQNHPHQLELALTPKAAEFVRKYACIRSEWNRFMSNYDKVRKELVSAETPKPSQDSIKERFMADPSLAEQWEKHEKYLENFKRWGELFVQYNGSEFCSESKMDESIKAFARFYFIDCVVPHGRKKIPEWFFDDRLDMTPGHDIPDVVGVRPSVSFCSLKTIAGALSVLRSVNFAKPLDIDFEKLVSDGVLFFVDDKFTCLPDFLFSEDDDGNLFCHLSKEEYEEARSFDDKLLCAYAECLVVKRIDRPRFDLLSHLFYYRDRLLYAVGDEEIANLRASIAETRALLNQGMVGGRV